MPSGAKKRKAAKKKLQKVSNNNSNGSHSNQGNDDAKVYDERDSDGSEVVREENVEGGEKGVILGQVNVAGKVEQTERSFKDVSVDADDAGKEFRDGKNKSSSSSSSGSGSSSSDDEEVVVEKEEEKPVEVESEVAVIASEVPESAEYVAEEASAENSVMSEVVDQVVEESIPVEEAVKQVVSLSEETATVSESVPVENSSTSEEAVDLGSIQNVGDLLQSSDETSRVVPAVTDLTQEKSEEKVIPAVDEESVNSSEPQGSAVKHDEGKGDSLPPSSGVTAVDVNVKESEAHKHVEEQPVISSAPPPPKRTSWMSCCGLFEAFSGGSGR